VVQDLVAMERLEMASAPIQLSVARNGVGAALLLSIAQALVLLLLVRLPSQHQRKHQRKRQRTRQRLQEEVAKGAAPFGEISVPSLATGAISKTDAVDVPASGL